MKQKKNRPRFNAQFKTFNSEQSCIDIFSRVQSHFLQKFYKYNLSDLMPQTFLNIEQDLLLKRIRNKQLKQLASQTFLVKKPISIPAFQKSMNQCYTMDHSELPSSFKYCYSNVPLKDGVDIGQNQLIVVQVKMRAQIQKIQQLPKYFYTELQLCQNQSANLQQKEEEELIKHLNKYQKKTLNLFIVYFGDINFQLFRTHNYQPRTISFFNNQLELKIYVFYVSRLALIQKFKMINKIQSVEYINDLLIQLYEMKREKTRAKRIKKRKGQVENNEPKNKKLTFYSMLKYWKWFAMFSMASLTFGAIYLRFFF